MIENEIIGDKEKGFDFTETISPEVIETPNYDYGRSQEPLDFNRLRNKPTNNSPTNFTNYKLYTGTYTAGYTGIVTVNIGFTPKYIEILGFFDGTNWMSWSDGYVDDTQTFCRSVKYTSTTQLQQNSFQNNRSFDIQEFLSSNAMYGEVKIITNGFTIEALVNSSSFNMRYIVKCFG